MEISGPDIEAADSKSLVAGADPTPFWKALCQRPLCCCCCKRRHAPPLLEFPASDAREIRPRQSREIRPSVAGGPTKPEPPLETDTGQEGYALLVTPRRGLQELPRDEDFYDARSEAASECGSPRTLPRDTEVQDKLSALLEIEQQCRGLHGKLSTNRLRVESILDEGTTKLWFCHAEDCPFVIGCLRCVLHDVGVGEVAQAIQNPNERLSWDGDSFRSFQVLRQHEPTDKTREDVIYTVMPAPRPVRDREILQRRWQLPLGQDGTALLMQSFEDDELQAVDPQRVRAFTHLSGYLLRPLHTGLDQGSLEVVVISQCDLGGALPSWFQNLARRLAKRRCADWAKKLEEHCLGAAGGRTQGA